MKVILSNITLTFAGRPYIGDLLMGLYYSTSHACLTFRDPDGEPLAHLSVNALTGELPMVAIKDWSENEGVAEQLQLLHDDDGNPILRRTIAALTCGYVKAPVFALLGRARDAYEELLKERNRG